MAARFGVMLVATVAVAGQITGPARAALRHGASRARHVARAPWQRPAHLSTPAAYGGADTPGQVVEQATARARREPGITTELDSSAKLTATGGPSGGMPSQSGGP